MNVKPGDLAITVRMRTPENNGVIVEVISSASDRWPGQPVWNVRHRTPMLVDSGPNAGSWVTDGEIHDSCLIPISGVPVHDEQLDEVIA